jgi:3-hydroxyisobutyrate dehydrogenase-like beta-hydroxyacid dehydrogenase
MHNSLAEPTTGIGILYPGEMGASLGRLLAESGFRVMTTLAGRSARTRQRCEQAGLEVLESTRAVTLAADVVLSLVCPAAALEVAEQFVAAAGSSARTRVYVDVNSISLATAARIASLVSATRISFVDGAIHGLACQLRSRGTMYLSGARAPEMAGLFERSLRVKVVGHAPGQASAFKGMMAGMSKGLAALFLEMGVLGQEAGVLDALLEGYREYYPGVMEAVERLVPTYPQHARRRSEEMVELESSMRAFGLTPCVVRGARQFISALGELDWNAVDGQPGALGKVREVIAAAHQKHLLRGRQKN